MGNSLIRQGCGESKANSAPRIHFKKGYASVGDYREDGRRVMMASISQVAKYRASAGLKPSARYAQEPKNGRTGSTCMITTARAPRGLTWQIP
jgi:hypothetical protein